MIKGSGFFVFQSVVHNANEKGQRDYALLSVNYLIVVQHESAKSVVLSVSEGKNIRYKLVDILCCPLVWPLIWRNFKIIEG